MSLQTPSQKEIIYDRLMGYALDGCGVSFIVNEDGDTVIWTIGKPQAQTLRFSVRHVQHDEDLLKRLDEMDDYISTGME